MIRSSAVYRVSTLANVIVGNASANTIMAGRASIRLENGVFTKVGAAGALSAGAFFVGVAAANDGLGGAVASVLKRNGSTKDIPTTGQDATDEGLQRVLLGSQCMTVYKAIKKEADAASALAIALAKATGEVEDTELKSKVAAVLLDPQAIFPENVKDVIADGYTTADKICTSEALKKACEENGVS